MHVYTYMCLHPHYHTRTHLSTYEQKHGYRRTHSACANARAHIPTELYTYI